MEQHPIPILYGINFMSTRLCFLHEEFACTLFGLYLHPSIPLLDVPKRFSYFSKLPATFIFFFQKLLRQFACENITLYQAC